MKNKMETKLIDFIETDGDTVTFPKHTFDKFLQEYIELNKKFDEFDKNKEQYAFALMVNNIDNYSDKFFKILSSHYINSEKLIKNLESKYNEKEIQLMCVDMLCKLNYINKYYNGVHFTWEASLDKHTLYEKDLINYLSKHIELIEKGMKYINQEVSYVDSNDKRIGAIDIIAEDSNGRMCVIETKTINNDRRLIYQCTAYPNNYPNCRMIVISPGYNSAILKELNKISGVEKFIYKIDKDNLDTLEIDKFKEAEC